MPSPSVALKRVTDGDVRRIYALVKTLDSKVLVSSLKDADGNTCFGLPCFTPDALGSFASMNDLIVHFRDRFRNETGLMIDFNDDGDTELAVTLVDSYSTLFGDHDNYYDGSILACITKVDSYITDLVNMKPVVRQFLQFVDVYEFADDTRFPKDGNLRNLDILPALGFAHARQYPCLLYTSPSPRDGLLYRMPSSA